MTAQAVQIGPARRSDVAAMATMSRDLIERGLGWRWTAPRIEAHRRREDVLAVQASVAGYLAGFAIMQFGATRAHLLLLAVGAERRRLGIGRRLLQWLEECADVAGIHSIVLELRARNAGALAFYRALGYEELRVLPGYYLGRESAIRMMRILRLPDAPPPWTPPRA
ncbi:MAG: GNAT family N-acetyltransferase [Gammaproteobacteria bacterium]